MKVRDAHMATNIKGADVSRYQAGLKLSDMKKAGYEFVILRGGYTSIDKRITYKDVKFEDFYKQAKEINMPVGVYYYSAANSRKEGIAEANFLYDNCLRKKKFEMPIYIDIEDPTWQRGRKQGVTDAAIGFCETLENLGFFVGVYASLTWFNNQLDTNRLKKYTKWVASWQSSKPNFKYDGFGLWQYSDKGKVGKYTVDRDIAFQDFPSIIKKAKLNGYGKTSSIYIVKKGDTLWDIAAKYLGDGNKYKQIKQLNGLKSDTIYPGQKLNLNV